MRDNMTDKEQIELFKQWWKQYGKGIACAVVLGLLIGFGWRYWREYQVAQTDKAALVYQELRLALSKKETQKAKTLSETLIHDYQRTPYAVFGAFFQAQQAVRANQLNAAFVQLDWVVENSRVDSFKQIARLRAARVLLADKKQQAALDFLKVIDDASYEPLVEKVRGDIELAMGHQQAAQAHYEAAQNGFSAVNVDDPFLDMQLVQLKGDQ